MTIFSQQILTHIIVIGILFTILCNVPINICIILDLYNFSLHDKHKRQKRNTVNKTNKSANSL